MYFHFPGVTKLSVISGLIQRHSHILNWNYTEWMSLGHRNRLDVKKQLFSEFVTVCVSVLVMFSISSDQYLNVEPNLRCCQQPAPHPQFVCLMDACSGALMEAAPCGCAAAGRLKLQVEKVMGCRRRSYIMPFYYSKQRPCLWCFEGAQKKIFCCSLQL